MEILLPYRPHHIHKSSSCTFLRLSRCLMSFENHFGVLLKINHTMFIYIGDHDPTIGGYNSNHSYFRDHNPTIRGCNLTYAMLESMTQPLRDVTTTRAMLETTSPVRGHNWDPTKRGCNHDLCDALMPLPNCGLEPNIFPTVMNHLA